MPPAFSRLLLTLSAMVLALVGAAALFLPAELLARISIAPSAVLSLGLQILGALSLGFAAQNWMNRHATIGGIYGRPLVVGNLLHFGSTALSTAKVLGTPEAGFLWPLAGVYGLLAVGFGVLMYRAPKTR